MLMLVVVLMLMKLVQTREEEPQVEQQHLQVALFPWREATFGFPKLPLAPFDELPP